MSMPWTEGHRDPNILVSVILCVCRTVCKIPHHSNMSALLLQLAGDATVRGTTTHDGMQLLSVYDFVNLACQNTGSYALDIRYIHVQGWNYTVFSTVTLCHTSVAMSTRRGNTTQRWKPARYQHTFAPLSIYQSIKKTVLSVLNPPTGRRAGLTDRDVQTSSKSRETWKWLIKQN